MKIIATIIWCALLLGACALVTRAQQASAVPSQFAKGEISDIKDKQRIYVNAGSPRQSANIIKELKEYQGVQVVDDPASADYVIAYRVEIDKRGVSIGHAGTSLQNDSVFFGRMLVYIPQKDEPGRLVWETRLRYQVPPPSDPPPLPGWRRNWEQPLEKSAVNKFIKALKKIRGEK